MARAYGLPLDPGMNDEFSFKRLRRGELELGPFTLTARRVDHPIEAYALRVECDGRSLVYSGDTAACDSLTRLATGADLLLAEAAFRDGCENPPHIHMTGSEAARTAHEAGAALLVLTHIPPWHEKRLAIDEAKGHFDGRVVLAAEGATYEV